MGEVSTYYTYYEPTPITPKVGRIDRLLREEAQLTGKKEMSFWSYARIAQDVFGSTCRCRLFSQVPYKKWIRNDVEELVPKYVKKGY